jgi:hypothetical protein
MNVTDMKAQVIDSRRINIGIIRMVQEDCAIDLRSLRLPTERPDINISMSPP